MKRITMLILSLFILSGCGVKNYSPIVDRPGPTYQQDLEECRALAEQRATGAQGSTVGALLGAGLGAVIGLVIGLVFDAELGGTIAAGALGGATGAGVQGLVDAHKLQKQIVVNCLQARGHSISGF